VKETDLHITSLQNVQVKNLIKLRGRRERDRQGLQLIEEPLVIRRALQADCPLHTVYYCPEHLDGEGKSLLNRLRSGGGSTPAFVQLQPRIMSKVSYRESSQGLLVVAVQQRRQLSELTWDGQPFFIILDRVEKPGNLGAILRSADGAGGSGVILNAPGPDPFNPNVLRASRGTCFSVPWAVATRQEILDFLAAKQIRCVATSPEADTVYTAGDWTGPVAFVLGAEDRGLYEEWYHRADQTVNIPLRGHADSLNVATTAALLLYEVVRQRSTSQSR
jgi:TrmH family RNA methyltransferase